MHDHAPGWRAVDALMGQILLLVARHPDGGLMFSSDWLPGWLRHAKGPQEIARALDEALVESDVAAYAQRRGARYDAKRFDERPRTLRYGERIVPDRKCFPASAWRVLPDGSVVSPGGFTYGPGTQMAGRIRAKQQRAGGQVSA